MRRLPFVQRGKNHLKLCAAEWGGGDFEFAMVVFHRGVDDIEPEARAAGFACFEQGLLDGAARPTTRNINSALDGASGPSFDYETSAPNRNSVFGGAGISANFADRWSASVFYNVNFGAEGYTNNIISTSLGFSF